MLKKADGPAAMVGEVLPGCEALDLSETTTEAGIPWLRFHRSRQKAKRRWPALFALPITTSPLEFAHSFVRGPVDAVLDVGATDRVWEAEARRVFPDSRYMSFDLDRTNRHDFYGWDEVDRLFDVVACLEVLEHVPPPVAVDIVDSIMGALRPGGLMVISVPNVFAPGAQLEFTHTTAFGVHDVAGLAQLAGGEVEALARFWTSPKNRRYYMHAWLLRPLHQVMRIDFVPSIVTVVRKPA
jgi:SAM-dependent methyltransferase